MNQEIRWFNANEFAPQKDGIYLVTELIPQSNNHFTVELALREYVAPHGWKTVFTNEVILLWTEVLIPPLF